MRTGPKHNGSGSGKHYAIMRIGKLKTFSELCEAMRHNTRDQKISFTDANRPGPMELLPAACGTIEARARALLKEKNIPEPESKNLAVEILCTASPGWWHGASEDQKRAFMVQSYRFAKDKLGDGLVSCMVHLDEGTPHIHAIGLPIYQKAKGIKGAKPTTPEGIARRIEALKKQPVIWMLSYDKVISGSSRAFSDHQTEFHSYVADLGLTRGEDTVGQHKRWKSLKSYRKSLDEQKVELDQRDEMLGERHRSQMEIQSLIDHDLEDVRKRRDALAEREQRLLTQEQEIEAREQKLRGANELLAQEQRQLRGEEERLEQERQALAAVTADKERESELVAQVLSHALEGTAAIVVEPGSNYVDVNDPSLEIADAVTLSKPWPKWAVAAAMLAKKLLDRIRGLEAREQAADLLHEALQEREDELRVRARENKKQEEELDRKSVKVQALQQAYPDLRAKADAVETELLAKQKALREVDRKLEANEAANVAMADVTGDIVKANATLAETRRVIAEHDTRIAFYPGELQRLEQERIAADAGAQAAMRRRDTAIAAENDLVRAAVSNRQKEIDAQVAERQAKADRVARSRSDVALRADRVAQDLVRTKRQEAKELDAQVSKLKAERVQAEITLAPLKIEQQRLQSLIEQNRNQRLSLAEDKKQLDVAQRNLASDQAMQSNATDLLSKMMAPETTVSLSLKFIMIKDGKTKIETALAKEEYPEWLPKVAGHVETLKKGTANALESAKRFSAAFEKVEALLPADSPDGAEAQNAAIAAKRFIQAQNGQGI